MHYGAIACCGRTSNSLKSVAAVDANARSFQSGSLFRNQNQWIWHVIYDHNQLPMTFRFVTVSTVSFNCNAICLILGHIRKYEKHQLYLYASQHVLNCSLSSISSNCLSQKTFVFVPRDKLCDFFPKSIGKTSTTLQCTHFGSQADFIMHSHVQWLNPSYRFKIIPI